MPPRIKCDRCGSSLSARTSISKHYRSRKCLAASANVSRTDQGSTRSSPSTDLDANSNNISDIELRSSSGLEQTLVEETTVPCSSVDPESPEPSWNHDHSDIAFYVNGQPSSAGSFRAVEHEAAADYPPSTPGQGSKTHAHDDERHASLDFVTSSGSAPGFSQSLDHTWQIETEVHDVSSGLDSHDNYSQVEYFGHLPTGPDPCHYSDGMTEQVNTCWSQETATGDLLPEVYSRITTAEESEEPMPGELWKNETFYYFGPTHPSCLQFTPAMGGLTSDDTCSESPSGSIIWGEIAVNNTTSNLVSSAKLYIQLDEGFLKGFICLPEHAGGEHSPGCC